MPGRWGPTGSWEGPLIFSLMLVAEEAVVRVWGEGGVSHLGSGQRLPWKRLRSAPRPCWCNGLNGGPPKRYVHVLIPRPYFKKGVFGVIKDLETRSSWSIQVSPKSSDRCPYETQGGAGPVTTETELGVMQPQAKDHLEPPEAGRATGRESPAQEPAEGAWPCWHLDCRLLASKRQADHFLLFEATVCGTLLWRGAARWPQGGQKDGCRG